MGDDFKMFLNVTSIVKVLQNCMWDNLLLKYTSMSALSKNGKSHVRQNYHLLPLPENKIKF